MNKLLLIGNLTKDPEIKTTKNGKEMAKFSLAITSPWEKDEEGKNKTDFFNCVAWGKTAEVIGNYLTKGSKVAVYGSISNTSWDKPDGSKGYGVQVTVNELEMLGSKKTSEGNSYNQNTSHQEAAETENEETAEIDLDDINLSMPF